VTATVMATELITPKLQRVRLSCPDLPIPQDLPPAAWVRGYFPAVGATSTASAAGKPTSVGPWSGGNIELADTAARAYTITQLDREAHSFALDFVLHGHGPAARWAAQAEAGQTVQLAGPMGRGKVQPQHQRYLLAGDTTALPAIREWLALIPPTVAAAVHIWAPDREEEQPIGGPEETTVSWSFGDSPTMADLAETATLAPAGWRPQDRCTKFFVAGEASLITRVRRVLAAGGPIPPGNLQATPYWRLGQAGAPEPTRDGSPSRRPAPGHQ
jgi:NADPH-dependent ferric siderophore reductase